LSPQLIDLPRLFQFAGKVQVVQGFNVEPLALAYPVPQSIGFSYTVGCLLRRSKIQVTCAQRSIGGSEIRVELDGSLELRHGSGKIRVYRRHFSSQAERPQRVERRRGGLH